MRHAKTVDGKIVKRKKKDKAKNRELSPYTDLPQVRNTGCEGRSLGVKNVFVFPRSNQSRLRQDKDNYYVRVFRRKTVFFEKQIMSKDKYVSIFSRQIYAIVLIILQIFLATRAILIIGEYH